MTTFHQVLANNLAANITNYTVWFAATFWIFLETRSVFATGMIAGLYLVLTATLAIWFGSLVDHHRKKRVMIGSSIVSLALYAFAFLFHAATPGAAFTEVASLELWTFVLLLIFGVIAGNVRNIALPTLVTAMVPEDRRDRANGLVGMVTGIGFLVTSAISGFLVAAGGMRATLIFAGLLTAASILHLLLLAVDEPAPATDEDGRRRIDLAGTIRIVAAVPGLFALILFAAFNNLLGGVFMALMDAYGLSLMEVQQWGLLWALVSCFFILSGLVISKTGLGANPLRTLLLVNLATWSVSSVFTLQSSILLLTVGCIVWMFLGPYAEAAEQTTLQKVVPYERQGRVFGFAQAVEQAAAPMTAFLIAPLAQFVFIPWMTEGRLGDVIGGWYGRGPERGIAIVFTAAGLIGVGATLLAFSSKSYRRISAAYRGAPPAEAAAEA